MADSTPTSEDVALFPGFDPPPALDEPEKLSADRRRTLRQASLVAAGVHPLTGNAIHPYASRDAAPGGGLRKPLTCGGCAHLDGNGWGYLKCYLPGPNGKPIPALMSHGPASDIRRWWPACPDYMPGGDV